MSIIPCDPMIMLVYAVLCLPTILTRKRGSIIIFVNTGTVYGPSLKSALNGVFSFSRPRLKYEDCSELALEDTHR